MEGLKALNAFERQNLESVATARPIRASNPKRSGKMERIMQKGMREVADLHIQFLGKCIEAIGSSLAYARSTAKSVAVHPRDCECCTTERTKRGPNPLEINFAVDTKINQAAQQLFSDLWGTTDINAQTPIQRTLYELVQEALADGYAQAESAWEKRAAKDEAWAAANPFPASPIKPTANMRWLQQIQERGFTNVRDKVFQQLTPDLKQSIYEQVASGLDVRQIAENLYSSFGAGGVVGPFTTGSGYLWQWQRLVRTEAHNAVFHANNEEFLDTGAVAVRWSKATNSCKICDGIASFNSGYYPITSIPEPPHPNCRCSTNPVFNLPKGITVGGTTTPVVPVADPSKPVGPAGTGTGKAILSGKHGLSKEELEEFTAHANAKLKEYGINDDITIKFFSKGAADGFVPFDVDKENIKELYLKNRDNGKILGGNDGISPEKMKRVFNHELMHVRQINSGMLKNTSTHMVWDGREIITRADFIKVNKRIGSKSRDIAKKAFDEYRAWPWEVEARAAE